ncbi:MAG: hypothetical protein K9N49_10070, partial [Candidatus Marinimicrobia bacterium]|nr:hypothetical protein [Candidatus Neomarinimicrobiota bacterium]
MSANRIAAENCPQCGGVLPHGYGERITCPYCGSSLVRLQTAAGAPAAGRGAGPRAAAGGWGGRVKG